MHDNVVCLPGLANLTKISKRILTTVKTVIYFAAKHDVHTCGQRLT